MIIQQTTHIVFEHPQDYLQEQEWCKTKDDRWIHVGQDTRCSIYENKISYCIGQPKDEPQTCSVNGRPYIECSDCENFRCTADEPQTEREGE